MNGRVEHLPVERIVHGTQHRHDEVDPEHLARLVAAYEDGPAMVPPIGVYRSGDTYDVFDGHGRLEAARAAGLRYIAAIVFERPANEKLELLASFDANRAHGRPPSREERREMAAYVAELNPTWSKRKIGRRVGVTHATVAAAIRERSSDSAPAAPSVGVRLKRFCSAWDALDGASVSTAPRAVLTRFLRVCKAVSEYYEEQD